MSGRLLRFTGVLSAVVVVVFQASGYGQQATAQVAPGARGAKPEARKWTPPRTPWGDPDVSGYFTNKDEQGVPFERPAEFAGRLTITDEEFAARETRLRQQLQTDNAEFDAATADTRNAGAVGSPTSPPPHWLDRPKPNRRTSMIIDPADGRIPPQTPEGQKRAAERAAARAQARGGRGPADSYVDRSLYDRCITRGLPGSMMPAIYGNAYQIVQGPGWVGIRYEMIHEIRVIPLEDAATRRSAHPLVHGGCPRPLGWQHAGRGDDEFQGRNRISRLQSGRRASDRTLHARGCGQSRVVRDRRRSHDVGATLDVRDEPDAGRHAAGVRYACHEGNYAMFNILSGARAEEKAGRAVTGGGDEGER